jgi:hypothetical protein
LQRPRATCNLFDKNDGKMNPHAFERKMDDRIHHLNQFRAHRPGRTAVRIPLGVRQEISGELYASMSSDRPSETIRIVLFTSISACSPIRLTLQRFITRYGKVNSVLSTFHQTSPDDYIIIINVVATYDRPRFYLVSVGIGAAVESDVAVAIILISGRTRVACC